MAQSSSSVSAVAITHSCNKLPELPANANDVHQHVFKFWKAMRGVLHNTRRWDHYKEDGNMFGVRKSRSAKTHS